MKKFIAAILAVLSVTAAMTASVFAGFEEADGEKYYYLEDGTIIKGRAMINGDYYYFSAKDGKMLRGATYQIGGKYYTFDENGKQIGNTLTPAPKEDYGIAEKDTGDVLTIYSYNQEVENILEDYYFPEHPLPEGVEVEYFVTMGTDEYAVKVAATMETNSEIDIFVTEPISLNLMTEYGVPLDELGLKTADLADLYKYSYQMASDKYGRVMGLPLYGTQSVLTYRRSIAKAVLGTDNPSEVAAFVKDIPTLNKTAALMGKAGYYTLGSSTDLVRMYNTDNKTPLVNNGKLTVPAAWKNWATNSRAYSAKNYFADEMWAQNWYQSIANGDTFAYVGPAWLVNFTLIPASDGNENDWAVTTPPINSYWGGTYLSVAKNSDNAHLAYDIIKEISLSKDIQEKLIEYDSSSTSYTYTPTLKSLTKELAASEYKDKNLGGQNPFAVYDKAAQMINVYPENLWYREALIEKFAFAMTGYINGDISYEEALQNFYTVVERLYPEIEIAK
jgi:hypothetical protein